MTIKQQLMKSSILAAHAVANRWTSVQVHFGRIDSSNGSTHKTWPVDWSVGYIERVFQDYLECANLPSRAVEGKQILEIGPGDNLGVALKFLAAGAAQVVSIDKFLSRRNPKKERAIYLALRELLPDVERHSFDNAVDLTDGIHFNADRLQYVYGHGIEDSPVLLGSQRFDTIVSRAVLEELPDLDQVFSILDDLLMPGGLQIHRVDLRDYGTLSRHGYHPLEFLTVPDSVYEYASKFSRPNRLRIDYYRRKMRELGYDARLLITRACGVEAELHPPLELFQPEMVCPHDDLAQLEEIRPRLLPRFRDLPAEDLMATGMMLVARKPYGK